MAPTMLQLSPHVADANLDKTTRSFGTHSRSTSAGSLPSDGQSSTDLGKSLDRSPPRASLSQAYSESNVGLPEYDYPAPFSLASALLPEAEVPSSLVVKNTFIDTASCLRPSTFEFYKERQTKSAPASGVSTISSGISLPPGLEDMFEPEETSAKIVAAEAAFRHEEEVVEMAEVRVTPSAMKLLPSGLFDDAPYGVSLESATFLPPPPQQPPAFDNHWQHQYPLPAPTQAPAFDINTFQSQLPLAPPPAFDTNWQAAMASTPLQAPLCHNDWSSPAVLAPPKHPVVLDLANALSAPLAGEDQHQLAVQQISKFCDQTVASSLPPMSMSNEALATVGAEIGSPECPTLGSEGHWSGTCKPCAFLYTKGCANGVSCVFCHLCDAGEKKRRAKDKRAALRNIKYSGC